LEGFQSLCRITTLDQQTSNAGQERKSQRKELRTGSHEDRQAELGGLALWCIQSDYPKGPLLSPQGSKPDNQRHLIEQYAPLELTFPLDSIYCYYRLADSNTSAHNRQSFVPFGSGERLKNVIERLRSAN
jgi:hypothetical protein